MCPYVQMRNLLIEFEGRTGHSKQLEQELTMCKETITRLQVELKESYERDQRCQSTLAREESDLETSRRELVRLRVDLEASHKEAEESRHRVLV